MPRIAHVISTRGPGGAERFLAALVAAGHARGYDQLVLNPFFTDASEPMRSLCDPVSYDARRCDRVTELPGLRRWLERSLHRFGPDIVHVLLFQALVTTSTIRTPPGARRLLTRVYGDQFDDSRRGRISRRVDRWAGSRFDHVVAISESVRHFLVSDYGYRPDRVTCIPLGWQGRPLPPADGPRPPTVVCVAALRPEKGHATLLRAISLVRRQVPDVRLVLVGQGACRPALEAQAAADGLDDSVEFLGAVPDVWAHLADADVFAIASQSEAFCIAVAEAMAAGLPVVAPAVGAIPELVQPGVTGELFPPGDHDALAGRLVQLLTSRQRRQEMSRAARAAAEPLRMEKAVERYFDIYAHLLEAGPRSNGVRSQPPGSASASASTE